MSFKYLTNIALEKAKQDYLQTLMHNGMVYKSEVIPVIKAAGRTTAQPVYAQICAPHYNASAMDGIALEAKLTFGASETTPALLAADQYQRLNTGDPLPEGCDCVVMIEDIIETDDGNGTVKLYEAAAPWQHIRQIGEDICAGEIIALSYAAITPSALGAMIAGGVTEISVIKRPVVGIIPTGDEIVPPTSNPGAGDILEFNSSIFSAMLSNWGAETKVYPIVPDQLEQIIATLKLAISECDIVILNAGSSAGSEDFAAEAIAAVGTVLYHGLAIKPGKPAILGYCGAKPVLGVPGYPVSGIIVIEQLLRPIVEFLNKSISEPDRYMEAVLSKAVVSTLKYREFVRVRMGYVGSRLIASPLSRGSGVVTSFMKADGIVEVPQGVEGYESGVNINVRLLRSAEELKQSLVVIGSHDPLLDELAELLRVRYGDVSLGSAHVGSMGGLLAIRREEAHVAGTHLLNTETGEYNRSFIQKLLPKSGARLVQCVKRTQGIITQKGNPKRIAQIADLAQGGLRYINRQKGSGTRILIDYLCNKDGLDTTLIYGYDREEFTHTSVAALIAAGSADAGLGVFSAAKLYGLDFIPICQEQYDLLIPEHSWGLPMVQKMLEVLGSDEFCARIDVLGGYELDSPGVVREVF
ncbi:MAG: molybdopterin biosynthesis protein [Oscillospiraceae bacterium]|nr:molybdopterin biosynthesis protein [Oscillospiraceae bacterium]